MMDLARKNIQSKKSKTIVKEECNLSFFSQETQYEDYQELQTPERSTQIDNVNIVESRSLNQSQTNTQKPISERSHYAKNYSYIKKNFFSVEKAYENYVNEFIICSKDETSTYYNICYKIFQKNNQTKRQKINILDKLIRPQLSGQEHFRRIKNYLIQQKVKHDKIEQLQLNFYKCQCGNVALRKQNIKNHLKMKSHKLILEINSKMQKKYQHKLYNQLDLDQKDGEFVRLCLLKSFQVHFAQGNIHHSQVKANLPFFLEIYKIRTQKQCFSILKVTQICEFFTFEWMKIYKLLHQTHKGNPRICHKCLTLQQHICLFILGISQLIVKNKHLLGTGQQNYNFIYVLNLIKLVFKEYLNSTNKKRVSPNSSYLLSQVYSSIRMSIIKLLVTYLKYFSYIDLEYLTISKDQS